MPRTSNLSIKATGVRAGAIVERRLAVHSRLGGDALATLEPFLGRSTAFQAGALIAQTGDHADLITVVGSGLLCRMNVLADGRRQIHSLMIPGDMVDVEAPLLSVRPDNIEALSDCDVWLVPKSRLAAIVRAHADLAEAFAREAAIAAQVAREWVVNVGRRSALERIAHLICELHARLDAVGMVVDGAFSLPLTQTDIADAQGMTAVHANRTLKTLRARRLIHTDKQRMTVLDLEGLQTLGMFDPLYLYLEKLAA